MSQTREALVQRLIDGYRAYFDVETMEEDSGLRAVCAYHNRLSQYVLVKKAELWAAESHEYLYLYSLPRLSGEGEDAQRIAQAVLEDGMPRIRPHREHMHTYLTAVIVCDRADPEAAAALRRIKKRREFKLSLHGWMELHIAAVDLSTGEIFTNRSGKDLSKALRPFVDAVLKSI